jgi:hypothetical protein
MRTHLYAVLEGGGRGEGTEEDTNLSKRDRASRSQLHDVFVTEDSVEEDFCALKDRPFNLQGILRVERLGKGFGNVFQTFSKLSGILRCICIEFSDCATSEM